MKKIRDILKNLAIGLVGALWLHTAPLIEKEYSLKIMLYVFGVLTSAFSLANLVFEAGWVKPKKI